MTSHESAVRAAVIALAHALRSERTLLPQAMQDLAALIGSDAASGVAYALGELLLGGQDEQRAPPTKSA